MYKCNSCYTVFENAATISEGRGEYQGVLCTETIYVCPNCRSNDFEQAFKCLVCEEYFTRDEMIENDSGYLKCKECMKGDDIND